MKSSKIWLALLLVSAACFTPAQQAPSQAAPTSQKGQKLDPLEMIKDVSDLLANRTHRPDLKPFAERMAKTYGPLLKAIPQQMNHLVADAEKQVKGLALREKMNLALELWRVRSSLDLLTLLTPETLAELTGLKVEDLRKLTDTFSHAQVEAKRWMPSWLMDDPSLLG